MAIEAPLDVARELYGGDPAEFVAARDRYAARARRDDGEERAEAIRALRKPTTAAWAVNRLAVEDSGAVAELIEVGDGLRAAQRDLRGDEIHRLDRRRDELVRRLLDRAGQIVKGSGRGFGEQARRQVESTLSAAVAEPDSARQVRQGVLSGALYYSGFGLDELSAAAMRRSSAGSRGAGGVDTGSERPGRKRGSARQRAAGRTERGAESGERSSRGTEPSGRKRKAGPDRAADRRAEQPAETGPERGRADSRRGTESGPRPHRRKTERAEAKREQAEPNSANSRDSSATRAASSTRSDSKQARTGRSADSHGSAKRSRSAAEDADTAAAELQRAETELDEAEQHRQDQQRRRDELRRELDDLGAQLRETDRRVSRARRHRNTARRRYDAARGDR